MPVPNCWEFMRCGREPGGDKVEDLGVCPAATAKQLDGINNGRHGGRACWGVPNTHCQEIRSKVLGCVDCTFFKLVQEQEGVDFVVLQEILQALKDPV